MLTMTLMYMIAPVVLFLVNLGASNNKKETAFQAGITLVAFAVITYLVVYFTLPSRNVINILVGNGMIGLLYEGIAFITLPTASWKSSHLGRGFIWGGLVLVVACTVLGFVGEIHSSMSVKPMWKSIDKEYSKSTEAPTFKRGETPVALAPNTVLNRVRKSMSDIPNSQYYDSPDSVQAQYYKGKPVYVVPLNYSGFFAMNHAKEIPGYFIVDATSQGASPKFVRKPYKYAQSAYFNHDVDRQIYRGNPEWLTMSNPQLEIDNQGTPYWVQTVYKSETLSHRPNYKKLHVVVMNAQTGAQKTYALDNLPSFVDEGITSDAASDMNKYFGKYKYGFWNWSKTGVIKPTNNGPEDGVTSVFNRDGSISYFTDFTNPNSKADSAMGYSMINARTGKLTYYSANGIMDSTGAKENADQNYKAQQWEAKMPVLYNINNRPTWVMTILDSSHAIRGYYYLDAQDQSIYGNGTNPASALDDFRQALVNNGATAKNTAGTSQKRVSGTVDRAVVVSSKNKVMFTLQGSNTVYTVNTNDYDKANLTRPGDKISFKSQVVKNQSVGNVDSFKNNSLK